MDPDYDGHQTAGFRFISINLRIDVKLTRALGLETHISEVQLVLFDLALIMSVGLYREVHRNYLLLRLLHAKLAKSHILRSGEANICP